MFDWTAAREEQLRKLWSEGLSGETIGDKFGVTRSCILARARKLNLPKREPRTYAPVRKRNGKPGPKLGCRTHVDLNALRAAKLKLSPLPVKEPPPKRTKTLMELGPRDCRYAYSQRAPYAFCGAATPEGSPYCERHSKICYQPLQPLTRTA